MKGFDLGQFRKTTRITDPLRSYSDIHKSPIKSHHENSTGLTASYDSYYLSRWGRNVDSRSETPKGILSSSNSEKSQSPPWVNIGQGIYSVAIGQEHVIILNNKNECFAYGGNSYGQLAQDTESVTRPTQISAFKDMKVVAVYCGAYHSFVQNAKGELYAFGLNLKGQLGIGSFQDKKKPTLVHSLLPGGIKNPKASFFIETSEYKRKIKPSHSRSKHEQLTNISNLLEKYESETRQETHSDPGTSFLLHSDESVSKVVCGPLHTAVLTNRNRLFVCGYGQKYALGTGDQRTLKDFQEVKINGICNSNTSNMSNSTVGSSRIEKLESGLTCLGFVMNGRVFISGKLGEKVYENFTHIPLGTSLSSTDDAVDLKLCEKSAIILSRRGNVYQVGEFYRENGERYILESPKKIEKLPSIRQIYNGNSQFFAISDSKSLYGWGENKHNQITAIPDENYISNPKSLKVPIPCSSESINIVSSNGTTFLLSTKPIETDYPKSITQIDSSSSGKEDKIAIHTEQRKRQRNNRTSHLCGTEQKLMLNEMGLQPRMFNCNMEIDFNELIFEKQISEGGYGIIYNGLWRETTVAIKMFKIETEGAVKDFFSECAAMEVLRHPNIVMFLGACTKPPNFAIVLEFCTRGSLWSTIQNLDIQIGWEDRRKFSLDTAKGVHYLHSCSPPILHRDLKSLNLLLDDNYRVKLADFGWTKNLDNYMTGKIGTYQWMAPEVIASQNYSQKADVFSYGIILWEIASRQPPFKHLQGLQVSIQVLNNDLRPTIPKKTPEAFAKLMKRCWDRDPNKRPSFKEIIKDLQTMKL